MNCLKACACRTGRLCKQSVLAGFLLAGLFIVSAAQSASATGDITRRGVYFGGSISYSHFSADVQQTLRATGAGTDLGNDSGGGIGYGVLLGWQRPIFDRWVIGLEGDWMIDERDLEFSGAYNQPAGTTDRYQLAHWGTVRGRLGYAISRHVLVSATAGFAIVDFDYRDNDTNLSTTGSEHALGWAAGAALDLGLHEHARLRVDGLYVDVHAWDVYGATTDQDVDTEIFVVRSSLIWAF